MTSPLLSAQDYRASFVAGLKRLQDENTLSSFILVAANATFDAQLYPVFVDELQKIFERLGNQVATSLRAGQALSVVEEDLLVFLKMQAIGFDQLTQTEFRNEGPWQLQFNLLRSFRPARISRAAPESLHQSFNPEGFNFNKPFMLKERFWNGELMGRTVDLYYNKYPFAPLHALIVPEREQCLPQYLTAKDIAFCWQLLEATASAIPGCAIGYNAVGAYASVNHLHLQFFVMETALPVMLPEWRHNGGDAEYPAGCERYADSAALVVRIEDLHRLEQPYNLVFTPGAAYLFPRARQGAVEVPEWMSGYSWLELAGGMLTFNREHYANLTAQTIESALARVRI